MAAPSPPPPRNHPQTAFSTAPAPSAGDDVVLIDLPISISIPRGYRLLSTEPPAAPFALPEPRNPPPQTAHHLSIVPLIESALCRLQPPYCKRRRIAESPCPGELDFHPPNISLITPFPSDPLELTALEGTTLSDISDLLHRLIVNPRDDWTTLTLQHPTPPKIFHIPPHSSFLLSHIPTPDIIPPDRYDLILLDPPWPNRSAARNQSYATSGRKEIVSLLRRIPIPQLAATGALVGVWTTNRRALREALLGEVARAWGCRLVAEWIWVKITESGDPIFDLNSTMRKPYEVLVLFRFGKEGVGEDVPGKVILGVPDRHSRKPGLKEVIKDFLPMGYRALEVFGRNLTEGWCTWGDEAIMWNWEGHLVQVDEERSG